MTEPKEYDVANLPEYDQRHIKRGLCPWCLVRLVEVTQIKKPIDACPECGDTFKGALTIDD